MAPVLSALRYPPSIRPLSALVRAGEGMACWNGHDEFEASIIAPLMKQLPCALNILDR